MSRRWFPHSLRVRLTGLHVAAMLLVLTLYAAAVFTLVARNASRSLDDRLRSDFRWASDMAQRDRAGALVWFEGDEWQEDSPWLTVLTLNGEPVFRTALARRLPVPQSEALARNPEGGITAVPGGVAPFRILTGRAMVAGQQVIIQVGRSEALLRQELTELLLVLVLGLPLSVAAAGLGGYWLARGALAPVDRMAERARAITAERLGERLPVDNPADELGRLATVFNATLGRLEASFEQMRRFTADVSHELRTPLTAIRSVGEVGLRQPRDAAGYRAVIGSMLEDANRLASLVDRLLTLSRADTGEVTVASEPVDLAGLAERVAADLGVLAEEKDQTLNVDLAGPAHCSGDRVVLRQALINLVDNAIKYTPRGGRIGIRVAAAAGQATLDVSDSGCGIPPELHERVFDRFYRGRHPDAGEAGAGLGLAIAKWAVEANRGTLTYEPAEGGGSLFRIRLPGAANAERVDATRPADAARYAEETA